MKRYSLVGIDPTLITHKGTINGKKPKLAPTDVEFAEPKVTAGKAIFGDPTPLLEGGLFAFDKKCVTIDALIGTATIVSEVSDGMTVTRATPLEFPFDLLAGEWLKFSSGSEVGCIVRLKGERIY